MNKLFILVFFILIVGFSFKSFSSSLDEAVCKKEQNLFTCQASYEDKKPSEACKRAREISTEGCLKENISCNTVDQITQMKDGIYSCKATSIGSLI